MKVRLKEMLGKGEWVAVCGWGKGIEVSLADETWRDRNTTVEQLHGSLVMETQKEVQYYYWREWVKEGRKIVQKELARMELPGVAV